MGAINDLARQYLRDYVVDGDASSGQYQPRKRDGRNVFATIDAALSSIATGLTIGDAVVHETQADLNNDLAYPAGTLGIVWGDSDQAKNGIYVKSGGSPGSWSLTDLSLPSTYVDDLSQVQSDIDALEAKKINDFRGSTSISIDTNLDIDLVTADYIGITGNGSIETISNKPNGTEITLVANTSGGFTLVEDTDHIRIPGGDLSVAQSRTVVLRSIGSALWRVVGGTAILQRDVSLKADDDAVVKLSGSQTINGTKTFSSAPDVPDGSFTIAKTSGLQSALNDKADDNAVVKLAGAQAIDGVKTFNDAPVVPNDSFAIAKINGLQTALDAKATTTALSAEAATRQQWDSAAKRVAEGGIGGIQTVGITATPTDGSSLGNNTYVLVPPSVGTGYVQRIRLYSAAQGTIYFRIFSRSGSTLTRVGSDYPCTVSAGLNTLSPSDFGYIPIEKDQYFGFYCGAAGRVTYVGGGITSHHWFTSTGDQTSFSDSTVDVTNEIQIGVEIAYAAVDEDRVTSNEAAIESIKSTFGTKKIERFGMPSGTPGSANSGVGGTYAFADPVQHDGYITRFAYYATDTCDARLRVWRAVGDDFALVANVDLPGVAGVNDFSSASGDFDPIPVKAGMFIGMYSDGNVNYLGGGNAYNGGFYRIAADVDYMAEPVLTTGIGPRFQIAIDIEYDEPISLTYVDPSLPIATDGSTLHRVRAKLGVKEHSGTGILRIGFIGDSWTQRTNIVELFRDMVQDAYGASGYGWISCDDMNNMAGLTHTQSGWTVYDASEDGAPDTNIGCAIDGKAAYATGTSATVSIAVECETFKIAYLDGDGTFRYRVDAGSWTNVVGQETGELEWVEISGLSDASHTFEIDLTGNTGTVVLYGYIASRSAPGVEVHKLGNAAIDGAQILDYMDYVAPYFEELELDAMVVILGTNDYRRSKPFSTFTDCVTGLIENARAAVPDCGVILWGVADSDGTVVRPITDYVTEMHRLSSELGCEFFNHHKMFGTFAEADALGMWNDSLHLNDDGGYVVSKELTRRFFWL